MTRRFSTLAASLVARILTAAVAACSNDGDSSDTSNPTSTSITYPADQIPATPVGDQLRWAFDHLAPGGQPPTVDKINEHISAEFLRDVLPATPSSPSWARRSPNAAASTSNDSPSTPGPKPPSPSFAAITLTGDTANLRNQITANLLVRLRQRRDSPGGQPRTWITRTSAGTPLANASTQLDLDRCRRDISTFSCGTKTGVPLEHASDEEARQSMQICRSRAASICADDPPGEGRPQRAFGRDRDRCGARRPSPATLSLLAAAPR
jgi:hypothetical protein